MPCGYRPESLIAVNASPDGAGAPTRRRHPTSLLPLGSLPTAQPQTVEVIRGRGIGSGAQAPPSATATELVDASHVPAVVRGEEHLPPVDGTPHVGHGEAAVGSVAANAD